MEPRTAVRVILGTLVTPPPTDTLPTEDVEPPTEDLGECDVFPLEFRIRLV